MSFGWQLQIVSAHCRILEDYLNTNINSELVHKAWPSLSVTAPRQIAFLMENESF
jgi:hypothetical protein